MIDNCVAGFCVKLGLVGAKIDARFFTIVVFTRRNKICLVDMGCGRRRWIRWWHGNPCNFNKTSKPLPD